jgi:ribosome biogenesis protein MAK21
VWHEAAAALPALPTTSVPPCTDTELEALRKQAEQLAEGEASALEREMARRNPADYRWLQTVKTSGTTADRVAAITLQVQVGCASN